MKNSRILNLILENNQSKGKKSNISNKKCLNKFNQKIQVVLVGGMKELQ